MMNRAIKMLAKTDAAKVDSPASDLKVKQRVKLLEH